MAVDEKRIRQLLGKVDLPWSLDGLNVRDANRQIADMNIAHNNANAELVVEAVNAIGDLLAERERVSLALSNLAADLVQDHRGIPYDVVERIDEAIDLISSPEPDAD